jgi:hypothetical protein
MAANFEVIDRDRGWNKMMAAVKAASGANYAKVGVLSDDDKGGLHLKDPVTGKASPLTVAELAVVHEFGTKDGHIPQRSWVRAAFDKHRAELERMAAKFLSGIVDSKMTVEKALDLMGMKHAAQIKSFVTQGSEVPPPNAPSTRRAKEKRGAWNTGGRSASRGVRTLVDIGRMVNATTWALVMGGRQGKAH